MARFQYKMQNILDIKYKLETQAKTAFRLAMNKLRAEEEKLQQLKDRRQQYEAEAQRLVSSRLDIPRINQCRQAIEVMKENIAHQTVSVHVAQRNVEGARARLNEIMIERKTHERLKEKAFEEFMQELEHEENKAIDELVSYSYRDKATS